MFKAAIYEASKDLLYESLTLYCLQYLRRSLTCEKTVVGRLADFLEQNHASDGRANA